MLDDIQLYVSFGLVDGKMVKVCLHCEGAAKYDMEIRSKDDPK